MAIKLKNNRPFTFAGLYDRWQSSEGDIITSCTIITTESNQLLAPIHNRMPVILPKNTYDIWLDKNLKDTNQLMDLLVPYDDDKMQTYPISPMVPSPKNNSPNLIKPLGKSALL